MILTLSKAQGDDEYNVVLLRNNVSQPQLLYYSHRGRDLVIAATETNHVTAVDADTGKVIFDKVRGLR